MDIKSFITNKLIGIAHWFASHWRTALLLLVAYLISTQDHTQFIGAFELPVAWVFLGAGLTLLIRKILFNQINLITVARDAVANKNIASAIIFASIVFLMGILLICATEVMKAPFLAGH